VVASNDGTKPIAAFAEFGGECGPFAWARNSPRWVFVYSDAGTRMRAAHVLSAPGAGVVEWSLWHPLNGVGGATFGWETGFGFTADSAMFIARSVNVPTLESLPLSFSISRNVSCQDALCVWVGLGRASRGETQWAYSPSAGLQELGGLLPGYAFGSFVTPDSIYTIVGYGPEVASSQFTEAKVFRSPRATTRGGWQPKEIATFDANIDLALPQARGDFVASSGCRVQTADGGQRIFDCAMYVANAKTGKTWRIKAPRGYVWYEAQRISDTELLIAMQDATGAVKGIHSFRRLRLDQLDRVEQASKTW
jgi:hypothetical protein